MKFLADAHISRKMVRFVLDQSHDCTFAAYLPSALTDQEVLVIAVREQRIIVTYDKDFGELVFRDGLNVPGVILIRIDNGTEDDRLEILKQHWSEVLQQVPGHFVTVTPERIRTRPLE